MSCSCRSESSAPPRGTDRRAGRAAGGKGEVGFDVKGEATKAGGGERGWREKLGAGRVGAAEQPLSEKARAATAAQTEIFMAKVMSTFAPSPALDVVLAVVPASLIAHHQRLNRPQFFFGLETLGDVKI
jgi:hypothetical protein